MLQHASTLNPFDSFPLHSKQHQEMSQAIPVGPRVHVAGCGLAQAVNRRRADSTESSNDEEPMRPLSPVSEEEILAASFEDSAPSPPVAVALRYEQQRYFSHHHFCHPEPPRATGQYSHKIFHFMTHAIDTIFRRFWQ
eukprot:TRINITY_DN473_c0_g1_i1.p3 TRINITY_DN473_c0_g1~~TRINITY_DN473_c0_g1_i1.p3  ORF type:complete len:138 (+),score=22.28 TRINITY_DN473_c0_g1_i1:25-438(+)